MNRPNQFPRIRVFSAHMIPHAPENSKITTVPPGQYNDALALLCSKIAGADRPTQIAALLAALEAGELVPGGMIGAYRGDRMVGAVLAQTQPGGTGLVWVPRLVEGESRRTAESLLLAECAWLASEKTSMIQCLLEPDQGTDEELLRSAQFDYLADLLYLVAFREVFPSSPPKGQLVFEAYTPADYERLLRMIEATYDQTLDCPALNGVRRLEDVLVGYQSTGVFEPSRWFVVRYDSRDVGCLLLADHPAHGNCELVYMGVASGERGHGWGCEIARYAQWVTEQAGRDRLVLAVDAANRPGLAMYSGVGFQAWDRRRVFLRFLSMPD